MNAFRVLLVLLFLTVYLFIASFGVNGDVKALLLGMARADI